MAADWLAGLPGFSALGAADKAATMLAGVGALVTDYRMWRSLGWMLLGLLLTWWGLLAFIGKAGTA